MRICMLLHKGVSHDTRVRREASALAAAGHDVTVVHLPRPGAPAETEELAFALAPATLRRGRERLPHAARLAVEAGRLALRAAATRPDAVHAHDAAMLLPGLLAARRSGAKLVYDSHELATGVAYRGRAWARLVAGAERFAVPRADAVIAVSDGIALRLNERYRPRRPATRIRNLPDLPAPGAAPVADLRRELGIGDAPLFLHQGAAGDGRGGATLLAAIARLPGAHLLFLGVGGSSAGLLRETAADAGVLERTHVLPAAAPDVLLSLTSQADVGLSLLENSCENHRLALPNKVFEYLAAGLPVVVSDLSETGRLVRQYGIGGCADPTDVAGVAAALQSALAQGEDPGLRTRLRRAADELSWEEEKHRLLGLYEELATTPSRQR